MAWDECWGVEERRVSGYRPTRKGARYPIKWTEEVERTGWYPNSLIHVCLSPPIQFTASTGAYIAQAVYQAVEVPTWIKRTGKIREDWIICGPKDEPTCWGRTETQWR